MHLWIDKREWDQLMHEVMSTRAEVLRIHRLLLKMNLTENRIEETVMATKLTDQALIEEVHRNTNVTQAATAALTKLQATNQDLVQKLADAIANSDAADDDDVKAALADLKANNDSLEANTPVLADAIANTDPNAPVPTV